MLWTPWLSTLSKLARIGAGKRMCTRAPTSPYVMEGPSTIIPKLSTPYSDPSPTFHPLLSCTPLAYVSSAACYDVLTGPFSGFRGSAHIQLVNTWGMPTRGRVATLKALLCGFFAPKTVCCAL